MGSARRKSIFEMTKFYAKSIIIASAAIGLFSAKAAYAKSIDDKMTLPPKIAIIGGGIGGTSCAYFLRELLGPNAQIDVFERESIVGGRLATINFADHLYEAGGSIIHKRNKYMSDFVDKFGLTKRDYSDSSSDDLLGLFNGDRYVFRESSWSLITVLRLFWRYGLSILRLDRSLGTMFSKFDRIYDHQENAHAFTSVEKLLESMSPDFVGNVQQSFREYLKSGHFSDLFATELADAAVRVNYGQNLNVTAFVGTVALAGAQKGLWSVQNGNRLVAEKLLEHSKAALRHFDVKKISKNPSNQKFALICSSPLSPADGYTVLANYDLVILAIPLIEGVTKMKFENFTIPQSQYGQYHRLVATFVHGSLNEDLFGACKKNRSWIFSDRCPSEILVCSNDQLWFNSVGALRPIDDNPKIKSPKNQSGDRVWKVFSGHRLSADQMNLLFDRVITKEEIDWLAYPQYADQKSPVIDRVRGAKFEPMDGVYHVNVIEWAASAMEMSVIGARNVALLAYHRLVNNEDIKMEKTVDVKMDLVDFDSKKSNSEL